MANNIYPNRPDYFHLPAPYGETMSFYANAEDPINSGVNVNFIQIDIVDCDFNVLIEDAIPVINKNTVNSNGDYHIYFSWQVPSSLNGVNEIQFVVFNTSTDEVRYISNPLQPQGIGRLKKVEYRDSNDIFEFYYSNIPEYTNVFFLPVNISKPRIGEESEGYDTITNRFERVRTTTVKKKEIITEWFDEESHDAFLAATLHDRLFIDFNRFEKSEDEQYSVEWTENYPLADGQIMLDDIDYAKTYKKC